MGALPQSRGSLVRKIQLLQNLLLEMRVLMPSLVVSVLPCMGSRNTRHATPGALNRFDHGGRHCSTFPAPNR